MRIGVIDKHPNKVNYEKHFGFPVDVMHLSSKKVTRLKKADIDLEVNFQDYDWIILIGAEALKLYTRHTKVTDYTGKQVESKDGNYKNFIVSTNPAMLYIKPEMKPQFEQTVQSIVSIIEGTKEAKAPVEYTPLQSTFAINEYLTLVQRLVPEAIGLDTETTGLYPRKAQVLGISMSHKTHQGVYMDADYFDDTSVRILQEIIDNGVTQVVLHNLKFDDHMTVYHFNLDFEKAHKEGRLHDTMVMHYCLDERQGTHGLKSLAMKYTDMGDYDFELDQFKKNYCAEHKIKQEDFTYDLIPFDVMWPYACLSTDSMVYLEDGSREKIGKLVREKYSGKVLSYNESTGEVEAKRVTNWIKNSHKSQEWRKIEYLYGNKSIQWNRGVLAGPAFTPDHRILTDKGYEEIDKLVPGHHRIATNEKMLAKDSLSVMYGCLMGDGSLTSRNSKGAGFKFTQSVNRSDFFDMVSEALPGSCRKISASGNKSDILELTTEYSHFFTDKYHSLEVVEDTRGQKLSIKNSLPDELNELSLAVWYMSDGNLPSSGAPRLWRRSVSGDVEEQKAIIKWLYSMGVQAHYHDDGGNNQFFVIDNEEYFYSLVSPYMAKDTEYKLPEEWNNLEKKNLKLGYSNDIYFAEFNSVYTWVPPKSRRGYSTSYCLDVEDNHNFLTDIGFVHNCGDTDATLRLFFKFWPILNKPQSHKIKWLYENVMMPTTRFLGRMEDRGIPLSKDRLNEAHQYLQMKLFALEEQLYAMEKVRECEAVLGKKFNPNSTQQLRTLLFDVIGLMPTGKMTETGADSTDAEVLEKLGEQHEVPKMILEIRKTSKLINSFIVKLLDNIDADDRIRTNFGCTTTTSGRLSSSGTFNAQQLPRDNPIIKGCIVAPPGFKVVAKDLTTAEVYYAAVLSGDRNLQQVFINMTNEPDKYADFHSTIAHMVFKLPCEPNEVKTLYPAMRQASKAITFGILYGSGPAKVAESVNLALLEQSLETGQPFEPCSIQDAKGYIETYFNRFPQLRRWIEASHAQIQQYGFIYSFYGRKRRLHNYNSSDRGVAAGEVRSGFNAIIQSASSDSLLIGVMDADTEIIARGLEDDMQIVGLVHDSIIAIVKEDLVDEYNEIIDRNVQSQKFNWDPEGFGALEIPGAPIGIDSDSEEGGSRDYSCGKMDKMYPFISVLDSPEMQKVALEVIEDMKAGSGTEYDKKSKQAAVKQNAQAVLESLQTLGVAA
jgi:DNA polymerase I-like protein with 3'-5' exonuclease and polymerase domains